MNIVLGLNLILKIIIPIIVILIIRYVLKELNPVTKCDNIIKMMVYIFIIAFLVFVEIVLFSGLILT